jgi:hypothetical protein
MQDFLEAIEAALQAEGMPSIKSLTQQTAEHDAALRRGLEEVVDLVMAEYRRSLDESFTHGARTGQFRFSSGFDGFRTR